MTGAEAVEARTMTETGAVDTVAGLVTVTVTDTTGSGPGAEQKKHNGQQETQPKRSDEAGSSELGRIHGKNRNWRVRRLGLFPGHMAGPTTALAQTRERGKAGA